MKAFFTFLFSGIFIISFGQGLSHNNSRGVDSIQRLLNTAKTDSLRVKYLLGLSDYSRFSNISKSRKVTLQAFEIIKNQNNKTGYWYAAEALVYDKLGVIERHQSNYEKAYVYYLSALKIREKSDDSTNLGRSYHNIAMFFSAQKEYKKARTYMQKALPLRFKFNDSVQYAKSLSLYGGFLSRLQLNDSALYYYKKSKLFYGNDLRIADANRGLARLYHKNKQYHKAIAIYQENINIYSDNKLHFRLVVNYMALSYSFKKLKQFKKAKIVLEKAKKIAIANNFKKSLSNIYREFYEIANTEKEYRKAMVYYQIYRKYKDTIYNIEKVKNIKSLELNYQFETEKLADSLQFANKTRELVLKVKNQKTESRLYGVLLTLAILGIFSLLVFFNFRKKLINDRIKQQELEKNLISEKLKLSIYQAKRVIADNKMRLEFKNEFLKSLKSIKFKTASENKEFKSLLQDLQLQITTEKRFDTIDDTISEQFDQEFNKKLSIKFPKLTKHDREICALIRIDLSIKEVAIIRNVSMPSIKSARYRIRKKMEVPSGIDLELFIQQLFLI